MCGRAPFRCPHCNLECESPQTSVGLHAEALLATWPDLNEGFWIRDACFLPVCEGRLLTDREVRCVVAKLLLLATHVALTMAYMHIDGG